MYYYGTPFTVSDPTFAARLSSFLVTEGWVFIDGKVDGEIVTEWPPFSSLLTELTDEDFLVVRPPELEGTTCTDLLYLEFIDADGKLTIKTSFLREGDAMVDTWDLDAHEPTASTVLLGEFVVDDNFASQDQMLLLITGRALLLASIDETTGVDSGMWMGYLQTAVLTSLVPTPVLGYGPDPWPLAHVDLAESELPVELFDANFAPASGEVVTKASGDDTADLKSPIVWPGLIPSEVFLRGLVMQGDDSFAFLRGVVPNVFPSSSDTIGALLRSNATGIQVLTISENLSVGPIG